MSDFQLLNDLIQEEREALADYKNFSDELNNALRFGTLAEEQIRLCNALDSALSKGIATTPLTLYRATCASYFPKDVGAQFPDPAFVSTSLTQEDLLSYYCADAPAKLVIHYPAKHPLACFEYDTGPGQENELLLPRNIRFQILSRKEIGDRAAILREQGTNFDRGEDYLRTDAKLVVLELGIAL